MDDVEFAINPLSGIAEKFSVADWHIIDSKVEPFAYKVNPSAEGVPGFYLSIEAKRKSGYFGVKVFIPMLLILAMSWIVFWIDPTQSGTQISVSVTSMLTLIAYLFMVGNSLPRISYLSRLDYFVLGALILVFLSLIEVVITSTLASSGRIEKARKIDWHSRYIFPLLTIGIALMGIFY